MGDEQFEGYTRVSTVLDFFAEPGLVDWMIKKGAEAKKIAKQAMKVGTEVDNAVKQFVASGSYGKVKTVEAKSCLEGFKRWFYDYKPSLTVGKRLFDEELKITGEPDLYWDNCIIDIKCASSIRIKYHIQTGIYGYMDNMVTKTAILRLHKHLEDYEFEQRTEYEMAQDSACFINLLQAYRHLTSGTAAKENNNADSTSNTSF